MLHDYAHYTQESLGNRVVGGSGMQFVDEFGIHVVPEVRYTRWEDSNFDNLTTRTERNQVEANISLTF